jgi:hypothetical protein
MYGEGCMMGLALSLIDRKIAQSTGRASDIGQRLNKCGLAFGRQTDHMLFRAYFAGRLS